MREKSGEMTGRMLSKQRHERRFEEVLVLGRVEYRPFLNVILMVYDGRRWTLGDKLRVRRDRIARKS